MVKRYLAVLLSGLMIMGSVCLTGCGSTSETATTDTKEETTKEETKEETKEDTKEDAKEDTAAGGDNLSESKDLLAAAEKDLKTTDGHEMMAAGTTAEVPEATASAEDLEKLEDTDKEKWHFYEYLDWDTANDATFPESPADGQKGKKVVLIVHGAHAWTTCYQEAFEAACDAVGMECEVYDPNWDQSTQDGYVDQAINEDPDAIVVIPVSADHAAQQFKKICDAGIAGFCSNTLPEADAMNYIMAYTGPDDWAQMRNLASALGKAMDGKGGVCYITHNVGTSPYYARTYGPMSTLATEYPDIKSLDVQSPGFEAAAVKQVVSDWITKYGDELNAIVLADDSDQAIGAVEACKDAGRSDIKIVAAGNSKQGSELVESGDLFEMSYQSCQADAGLAVRTISEYFCGEDIARVSYIGTDIINKDNVADFTPCQW
ncbi:MAG: sugar ABC transporter substrate-binding protein [Lachnospiraceae bacterium]|nr:sugar ABC transporter substrate-binding protein [Lachnospiraceae bacterium]